MWKTVFQQKRVSLYVTPSDCLNVNLAENKMLTEQPALLFCAQQKLTTIISTQSCFIYKTLQDKSQGKHSHSSVNIHSWL